GPMRCLGGGVAAGRGACRRPISRKVWHPIVISGRPFVYGLPGNRLRTAWQRCPPGSAARARAPAPGLGPGAAAAVRAARGVHPRPARVRAVAGPRPGAAVRHRGAGRHGRRLVRARRGGAPAHRGQLARRRGRAGARRPEPRLLGHRALRSEEHTSERQSRENLVCRLPPTTYPHTLSLHDALPISGFGQSPAPDPERPFGIAALVDTVADWCAHAGVERPHIAGNSLGGAVALELGARGLASSVTAL